MACSQWKRGFFTFLILLSSILAQAQVNIKAVGDIMPGSYTPKKVFPPGHGQLFVDSIGKYLQGAPIVFGNLECVLVDTSIQPQKCSEESREAMRCFEFGAAEWCAPLLKDLGFTVLSLDNNHVGDYGMAGYQNTQRMLDSVGIAYAEREGVAAQMADSQSVGVIAFGFSEASYHITDLERTRRVIRQLDDSFDILVASFHGGAEGSDYGRVPDSTEIFYGENRGNVKQFAHTAVEAGAELVLGHGPHVLRGIEIYQRKLIAYSLGNFLTYGHFNLEGPNGIGAILEISLNEDNGNFIGGNIIPTEQIGWGIPTVDPQQKAIQQLRDLTDKDFPETDFTQLVDHYNYRFSREILDTLCSTRLGGRGYVHKGDSLAATYLRDRFRELGVKPFSPESGNPYWQRFPINVNTFPNRLEFMADQDTMIPGVDYLVEPYSGSKQGTYPVRYLPASKIKQLYHKKEKKRGRRLRKWRKKHDFEGHILTYPADSLSKKVNRYFQAVLRFDQARQAEAVVALTRKKLTWHVSDTAYAVPYLTLKTDTFSYDSMKLDIRNKLRLNYKTQNVLGYVEGKEHPDSFIVFTAHYDHLGRMGPDTYFPGANDNASGTTLLLRLARYYAHPDHQPDYSIAFIAFGAEEAGILGSEYFTNHPAFSMDQIRFLVNVDMVGMGSKGITVVNGKKYRPAFDTLVQLNQRGDYLPDVKIRGPAKNSDHYYFSAKGVPSFFIYTRGGSSAYHDIYDRPSNLTLAEYDDLTRLLRDFATSLQR